MKLTQSQQFKVVIAVFALVFIGEGVFAYFCWNRRTEALAELEKLDRQESAAQAKKSQITNLKNNARELQAIIEEYVQILPTEDEVGYDDFVEDIDAFAKRGSLSIASAVAIEEVKKKKRRGKKDAPVKEANFVKHKYRFQLEGTFRGFLQFLTYVENHSRFLQVEDFSIRPAGQDRENSGRTEKHLAAVSAAENPIKDITVEISTYTYSKEKAASEGAKK